METLKERVLKEAIRSAREELGEELESLVELVHGFAPTEEFSSVSKSVSSIMAIFNSLSECAENFESLSFEEDDMADIFKFKVGDTVYCNDNNCVYNPMNPIWKSIFEEFSSDKPFHSNDFLPRSEECVVLRRGISPNSSIPIYVIEREGKHFLAMESGLSN